MSMPTANAKRRCTPSPGATSSSRPASASAALALASLLDPAVASAAQAERPARAMAGALAACTSPPKAKRVIYLFMAGAPSQLDLFDYKPELVKHDGQAMPEEFVKGERFAFIKGTPKLLGSPVRVPAARRSRARGSPSCCRTLAKVADDIAIVRSMHTTSSTTRRRRSS